eukprot:UN25434
MNDDTSKESCSNYAMEKVLQLDEKEQFNLVLQSLWNDNWTTRLGIATAGLFTVVTVTFAVLVFDIDDPEPFTSPTSELTKKEFDQLVTLCVWAICLSMGIFAEMFVGTRLVTEIANDGLHWMWVYAQLVFAVFLLIAIVSQSVFGIPFAIVGLFKCGFPEVISYLHRSCDPENTKLGSWTDFMNGVGLLTHHASSLYLCVALSLRFYHLDDHVTICGLLLMMQHAFVILKYFHFRSYVVIELGLEIWWQMEVYGRLAHLKDDSMKY